MAKTSLHETLVGDSSPLGRILRTACGQGKTTCAALIAAAHDMLAAAGADAAHARQVARLAAKIFDDLHALHSLPGDVRLPLVASALLHDIAKGRSDEHHMTAARIIMAARRLPLASEAKRMAALVARYHRKEIPSEKHYAFALLPQAQRQAVIHLAAILRLADALDTNRCGIIDDLCCRRQNGCVVVVCDIAATASRDARSAVRRKFQLKSELFQSVFNCSTLLKLRPRYR